MEPKPAMFELGRVLRQAREAKRFSARRLAAVAGVTHSFISKLEAAQFQTVSADNLAALARALGLPAEDLFALAGYRVPEGLPTFGPYLRARYGKELPEHAMGALDELFGALREKYSGSDSVDDEENEERTRELQGGLR